MSIDHIPEEFSHVFSDVKRMDKLSEIIVIVEEAERATERSYNTGDYNVALANLRTAIGKVYWALDEAKIAAKEMLRVRKYYADHISTTADKK